MKTFPRPTRRAQADDIRILPTPEGSRAVLPDTPIEYEVTPIGKGEYEPRHKFTPEECSLGGHVAALTLLTRYADAYADSDEEWEALAGSRLDAILRARANMKGRYAGF